MLAKQLTKDREVFCPAETPLAEVFNKMNELGCECMPVVESLNHKNVIGCITEHEICLKLINGDLNPKRANAGRVMSGDFTTVKSETPLEECAVLLKLSGAKRLFVIDENGAFLGVLTEADLAEEKPRINLETVINDYTVAQTLPPQTVQMAF
jgi:CBS domain-containing protein